MMFKYYNKLMIVISVIATILVSTNNVIVAFAADATPSVTNIQGHWASSEVGSIDFIQNGSTITGSWSMGTISGSISGNHCTFQYRNADPLDANAKPTKSEGSFDVIQNGMGLTGVWHYVEGKDTESGAFSAIRVLTRSDSFFSASEAMGKELDSITEPTESSLENTLFDVTNVLNLVTENGNIGWKQTINGNILDTIELPYSYLQAENQRFSDVTKNVKAYNMIPEGSAMQAAVNSLITSSESLKSAGQSLLNDPLTQSAGKTLIARANEMKTTALSSQTDQLWVNVKIEGQEMYMLKYDYSFMTKAVQNKLTVAGALGNLIKETSAYKTLTKQSITKFNSLEFSSDQVIQGLLKNSLTGELKETSTLIDTQTQKYRQHLSNYIELMKMCIDIERGVDDTQKSIIRNLMP